MKKTRKAVRRMVLMTLIFSIPFSFNTAGASAPDSSGVTLNNNDSLSRLFGDKPEYCLLCGEIHTGTGGMFTRFFHETAYFFCGLIGKFPDDGRMYFTFDTIDAGIDEPFYFIHAGDTHVSYIDERDYGDERLIETANARITYCPKDMRMLDDLSLKARELDALIVHTGDLIDFVSRKNLDIAKDFTSENDVFACAGNHEYHVYIWDDGDDYARRDSLRDKVKPSFTNDIDYSVRVEHGVKFIAVDNSNHKIEKWQLDLFKEELAKDDMPVVLALHVPLYAPDIFKFQMEKLDYPHPAWLMGVPEDVMKEYNYEEQWIEEQKANEATEEFYDIIINSAQIKAIVTGHDHAHFVSQVTPALKQYMVDTTEGQIFYVK